jgi:hypothetical protein
LITHLQIFHAKWPDVIEYDSNYPNGIISLVLVSQKLKELPYLIRDGLYDQSVLDEFKYDFNMLNTQYNRDKKLKELGI